MTKAVMYGALLLLLLAASSIAESVSISPSNAVLNTGQIETYTITVTGAGGPFNVMLYNITGSKSAGNVIIPALGGSNTISFVAGAVGDFVFNATAIDTSNSSVFNSMPEWAQTVSYPSNSQFNSCPIYNGYIYCVGGLVGASVTNSVYYAPISSNGAIGSWTKTTDYPTPIEMESCVTENGYIYCMAGNTNNGPGTVSTVYSAQVSSSGVGSWTSQAGYPFPVFSPSCVTVSGYIECVGGVYGITTINHVYFTKPSNGAITSWTPTASYPTTIDEAGCTSNSTDIYCINGQTSYSPTVDTNSVYWATVNLATGNIPSWSATANYPITNAGSECSDYRGAIFCAGGSGSPYATADVFYAPTSSSGISSWTQTQSLPLALEDFTCSIYKGYFYCVGGINNSGLEVNDVIYAPLLTSAGSFSGVGYSGITVDPALTAPSITSPSAANTLDLGQSLLISASPATGGTLQYNYSWSQYSGTLCPVSSFPGDTLSFTYTPPSTTTSCEFQVKATDNASTPASATSLPSPDIIVNPALTITNPTLQIPPSNSYGKALDEDQSVLISSTPSGGTPSSGSYTCNMIIAYSSNSVIVSNDLFVATDCGNTFSGLPLGTFYTKVSATDSATNAVTVTTSSNTFTVNAALTAPAAPSVDYNAIEASQGDGVLVYAPTTGTGPYNGNWLVSVNGGSYASASSYCFISSFSNVAANSLQTCIISGGALTAGNTYNFKAQMSDSASVPENVITAPSPTITVYSTPTLKLFMTPSNSVIFGNSVVTNAIVTGGSGHFSFSWKIDGVGALNATVNSVSTSNTLASPSAGSHSFVVNVVDNGVTAPFSFSATNTLVVGINSNLLATCTGGGSVGFYTVANVTCTGVPTLNNQSAWELYVNGALYKEAASKISWYEQAQPGTYNFLFKNPGNANYTANSITAMLSVQQPPSGGSGNSSTTTTTTVVSTSSTVQTSVTTTIPSPGNIGSGQGSLSSSTPLSFNFFNNTLIVNVTTNSSTPANAAFAVVRVVPPAPAPPVGYIAIVVLNASLSYNNSANLTITQAYNCAISPSLIKAFIWKPAANAWVQISGYKINSNTCDIVFAVPKDPIVGVFEYSPAVQSTTSTPVSVPSTSSSGAALILIIAIIVIVVVLILLYSARRAGNRIPRSPGA